MRIGEAAPPAPASPDHVAAGATGRAATVEDIAVTVCTIPTDQPESDGTLEWDSTTIVIVQAMGGGHTGIGYTYGTVAAAQIVHDLLRDVAHGNDVLAVSAAWEAMRNAVRNIGLPGAAACAIAAVDNALWDLAARFLGVPLARLLGMRREYVPVYGSGGFTSYGLDRLCDQLAGWVDDGIDAVKMKVGREPARDAERVKAARLAIGREAELFIDANGAYNRRGALGLAEAAAAQSVTWFEEPVTGADLEGLHWLRDRAPASMSIAAGEYAWEPRDVRRMIDAHAVDVIQVDATRCCGITGFLMAAALCETADLPLSAHTAPSQHLHPCLAAPRVVHLEYFHDHVRIERQLFDGFIDPVEGRLHPDMSRPGTGLELRQADIERYRRS